MVLGLSGFVDVCSVIKMGKTNRNKTKSMKPNKDIIAVGFSPRRLSLSMLAISLVMISTAGMAKPPKDHDKPNSGYLQTNLVSDLPGIAQLRDTNLLNPWGISFSATSPFWISDNGSGLSTLYAVTNDTGGVPHVTKQGLEVAIPGDGVPTGQLFDGTGSFNGDVFIFAGEDGTISGWRSSLGTTAELLVSRTNAVYKGITLVNVKIKGGHKNKNQSTPLLLLANFREGTVDIYNTNMDLMQISDPKSPVGYAPFNVQNIDGDIFVTFAKQDGEKHDDVAGPGHGFIDVLDLKNGKFHRFATGTDAGGKLTSINSPWGLALAPKSFGEHNDELLVGNFGSGTIMAFGGGGNFRGLLEDTNDAAITIDGLWGLSFGNGGNAGVPDALYFTAGPNSEADGLFGSIVPAFPHERKDKDKDGE
jgi:uncharacterized protein (TIGR03118 family)